MKKARIVILILIIVVLIVIPLVFIFIDLDDNQSDELRQEYTKGFPQKVLENKKFDLNEYYPLDSDLWKTSGHLDKKINENGYDWTIKEDELIILSIKSDGTAIDEQLLFHKSFIFPDVLNDSLSKITLIENSWYHEECYEPGLTENNKEYTPVIIEPKFTNNELEFLRNLVLTTDSRSAPIYFVKEEKVTDGWYADSFYWDKRNYTPNEHIALLNNSEGIIVWEVCWHFKTAESIYYLSQMIAKDINGIYYFCYDEQADYIIELPINICQKIEDAFTQANIDFNGKNSDS